MKKKELIRCLAFLLLSALLLTAAALVFDRKYACDYFTRVRGFYNEPEDSMDVMFYGTSHMYCTVSPLALWKDSGLHSYVLATQQQPLLATYYYMKESLEHQSPKLMVLELLGACSTADTATEAVFRDCLDPLPWSRNKIELIQELVPRGQRSSYYFNFLKYHSRWKELNSLDLDFSYRNSTDSYKGYIYLTPARPSQSRALDYSQVEARPIPRENISILLDMKALAEEHGARLAFIIAPYEDAGLDAGIYKSLHQFALEQDIPLLDFNQIYDQAGFDGDLDFFDSNHLNSSGASKATARLADWLEVNFELEAGPSVDEARWQALCEELYSPKD